MERRFREGWRGELLKCPRCGKLNLFSRRGCRKCRGSLGEAKK